METQQVQLINDALKITQLNIDWVGIIALIFSVLATIGTLWWQGHIRKKDLENQDAHWRAENRRWEEERERQVKQQQQDNVIKKWLAEYPYKLKFYTEFYDTLFKFVNYCGSAKSKLDNCGTDTRVEIKIRPTDIQEFCNTFNRLDEEAKVLFGDEIIGPVHMIYEKVKVFIDAFNIKDLSMIIENHKYNTGEGKIFNEKLKELQNELKEEKLNYELRYFFASVLKFPEIKQGAANV